MPAILVPTGPDHLPPLPAVHQRTQVSLIFLDTPDLRLWQAGLLLARGSDRLDLIQVAEPFQPVASLATRRAMPRLVTAWPSGALKDRLLAVVRQRALLPTARAEVVEDRWRQGRAEAVVRQLADAPGSPPWALLPGEPGPEWAGWRRVQAEPLAARMAAAAEAAHRPTLRFRDPEEPAAEAVRHLLLEDLDRVQEQEVGVIEDIDSEFLHQHRVCLRRMRSLLKSLAGVFDDDSVVALRTDLGALARRSNRLRDLDVWLERRDEWTARLPPALRPGLVAVIADFTAERRTCQRDLAQALRRDRKTDTLGRLRARLEALPGQADEAERPIREVVREALWRSWRAVAKRAADVRQDTPAEEIHEVRIRGKRLRYLLDASLEVAAPQGGKDLVRQLKRVQEVLGRSNDAAVQLAALTPRALAPDTAPDTAAAVGALLGLLHQEQEQVKPELLTALSDIAAPATRHRYEDLFHAKPAKSAKAARG